MNRIEKRMEEFFCLPGMSKLFCKDIVLITYNGKTLYKRAKK